MAGKTRKQIESEAIARKLKRERKRLEKYYADSRLDTREHASDCAVHNTPAYPPGS